MVRYIIHIVDVTVYIVYVTVHIVFVTVHIVYVTVHIVYVTVHIVWLQYGLYSLSKRFSVNTLTSSMYGIGYTDTPLYFLKQVSMVPAI